MSHQRRCWLLVATATTAMISISINLCLAQTYEIVTPVSATAEVNPGDAAKTIDNNPNECNNPTYWQAASENACITFDLGEVRSNVTGFRESAGPFPGNPFTAGVSTNQSSYTQVATGTLASNYPPTCTTGEHVFTPQDVRFIKLCVQRTDAGGSGELVDFRAIVAPTTSPGYSCTGFEPPFDEPILIRKKANRAIPVKMKLFDNDDSGPVTDSDMVGAKPVINVQFSGGKEVAIDATDQLEPLSQSTQGNVFRFDPNGDHWIYNLGTTPFANTGTYTVTVKAGDNSYDISPTCMGQFVRSD